MFKQGEMMGYEIDFLAVGEKKAVMRYVYVGEILKELVRNRK